MKKYVIFLLLIATTVQAQRLGLYGKDDFRFLQKEIENLTPGIEFILLKATRNESPVPSFALDPMLIACLAII